MQVIRQILGSPTAERKRGVLSVLADGRSAWARWAALAFSLAAAKSVFAEPTTLPPVSSGGAAAAGNGDFIISASKHSSEGGLLPGYDAYLKLRPDGSQISYHALATRAGDETTGGGLGLEGENWRLGGYQSDYFIDPESELGESLAADGVDLSKRAITAGAVNGYLNHQTVSGGSHQFGFEFVNGKSIHNGLEDSVAARDRFGYGYERIFDGSTVERVIFSLTGQQETAGFGDPELNIEEPLARKYSSGSIAAGLVASITEKCKLALGLVAHNGTTLGARGEDGLPTPQEQSDAGVLTALGCYQDSASSSAYSGILGYNSSDNTVSGAGSVGPFTLDFSYQKGQDGQPDEQKVALGFQRALTANSNGSVRKNGVADFIRGLFKMPSKKYRLQDAAAAARNIASIVPTAAKQEETPDADEFNNAIASSDTPNVSLDGTVINGFFDFETEITQAGIDDGNYTATSADGNLTIGTLELDQLGNLIVPYSLADDASVVAGDKVGLTLTWPTGNSQVFEITVEAAELGTKTLTGVSGNNILTLEGGSQVLTFSLSGFDGTEDAANFSLVSSDGVTFDGTPVLSSDGSTLTGTVIVPGATEDTTYTATLRYTESNADYELGDLELTVASGAEVVPSSAAPVITGTPTVGSTSEISYSLSANDALPTDAAKYTLTATNESGTQTLSHNLSADGATVSADFTPTNTGDYAFVLTYIKDNGETAQISSSTVSVVAEELTPTLSIANDATSVTGGTGGTVTSQVTITANTPSDASADDVVIPNSSLPNGITLGNVSYANGVFSVPFLVDASVVSSTNAYQIPGTVLGQNVTFEVQVAYPGDPDTISGSDVSVESATSTTTTATINGWIPSEHDPSLVTTTVNGISNIGVSVDSVDSSGVASLTITDNGAISATGETGGTILLSYNGTQMSGSLNIDKVPQACSTEYLTDLGSSLELQNTGVTLVNGQPNEISFNIKDLPNTCEGISVIASNGTTEVTNFTTDPNGVVVISLTPPAGTTSTTVSITAAGTNYQLYSGTLDASDPTTPPAQ